MIYCFRCTECGHQFTLNRPMSQYADPAPCPDCRQPSERDYQAEGAAPASEQIKANQKYPYVSNRLPKGLEGCEHTSKGKPVIMSQRHEREIMRRHGYHRD